jgi:hypothetical protein
MLVLNKSAPEPIHLCDKTRQRSCVSESIVYIYIYIDPQRRVCKTCCVFAFCLIFHVRLEYINVISMLVIEGHLESSSSRKSPHHGFRRLLFMIAFVPQNHHQNLFEISKNSICCFHDTIPQNAIHSCTLDWLRHPSKQKQFFRCTSMQEKARLRWSIPQCMYFIRHHRCFGAILQDTWRESYGHASTLHG